MSQHRATNAELVKRREEIQTLILSGVSGVEIQEEMAKKWNTSKRAIADDIRYIGKEWEEQAPQKTQSMKNKYMDRLEMLLNKALQNDHIKTALEIQKEINKLNGLYSEKDQEKSKMPEFIPVKRASQLKVVGEEDSD